MKIKVAPFAGAWIEIDRRHGITSSKLSLPSRERGLKFVKSVLPDQADKVAPFAGAWIEITSLLW